MAAKTCKKKDNRKSRGPRPKEVAAGEADAGGVSSGVMFFSKGRVPTK